MGVASSVEILGLSYAVLPDWPLSVHGCSEPGLAPMKLHKVEGCFKPMSTTIGVAYSDPEDGRGSA